MVFEVYNHDEMSTLLQLLHRLSSMARFAAIDIHGGSGWNLIYKFLVSSFDWRNSWVCILYTRRRWAPPLANTLWFDMNTLLHYIALLLWTELTFICSVLMFSLKSRLFLNFKNSVPIYQHRLNDLSSKLQKFSGEGLTVWASLPRPLSRPFSGFALRFGLLSIPTPPPLLTRSCAFANEYCIYM